MVYGIEASLPLLKKSQSAQLIGMSSTAAYLGFPRSEAYGASKAAIYNMFKALAVSLKPHNIASSVICPGFIATELTAKNTFRMPALVTVERAAENILQGIREQQHEIHFPKRFSWCLKFISYLPLSIQYRLLAKTLET
jgi:short-subunit dehydrogenase